MFTDTLSRICNDLHPSVMWVPRNPNTGLASRLHIPVSQGSKCYCDITQGPQRFKDKFVVS